MAIGGFQIWRGSNGAEPASVLQISANTILDAHA